VRGGDGVGRGCDAAEVALGEAERVAGGESGLGVVGRLLRGVGEWWLTVWSAGAVWR
jgi:hypothetical protein